MTTEQTARSKVSQWVRERIKDETEVSLPGIRDEAIEHFRKDTKLLRTLAEEMLREMVWQIALRSARDSRSLVLGDEVVNTEGLKRRVRSHSVFATWLEHAGDKHIRLMDMTREELLIAADEREKRGQREVGLAALWRTMAGNLEGGQVVGSKYTPEQIESMHRGLSNA